RGQGDGGREQHFGNKSVGVTAAESALERVLHGKVSGLGIAGQISVGQGIQSDRVSFVETAAAEIRGEVERRSGGVKLRQKGVGKPGPARLNGVYHRDGGR